MRGEKKEQAKNKIFGKFLSIRRRHFQAVNVYLSFVIKFVPVGTFIDCHSNQNKGEDMKLWHYIMAHDTIRFDFRNDKHSNTARIKFLLKQEVQPIPFLLFGHLISPLTFVTC